MVRQIDGLRTIPGVGPSIAKDLRSLGIREVTDLRGCNAETMYADLCDRCRTAYRQVRSVRIPLRGLFRLGIAARCGIIEVVELEGRRDFTRDAGGRGGGQQNSIAIVTVRQP